MKGGEYMLKKDKEGYYRKSFTINGIRYQLKARSEKELWEKYAEAQIDAVNHNRIFDRSTTVNVWAREWLETYLQKRVCTKSFKTYKANLDLHILPHIGKMKINEIQNIHLQKVLNKQDGKSKSHVNHVKIAMTALFKDAKKNNIIKNNPALDLDMPEVYEGKRRPLTDNERAVLLTVCETHYAGLWALVMLYCGLRPSEAAALTRDKIDIVNEVLLIDKTISAGDNKIKPPKTKAGIRTVPIPNVLLPRLQEALKNNPVGYLFSTANGSALTGDRMCAWWNSIKREMDIAMGAEVYRNQIIKSYMAKDLTAYCLRHTYCTDLERAGISLPTALPRMRHLRVFIINRIFRNCIVYTVYRQYIREFFYFAIDIFIKS